METLNRLMMLTLVLFNALLVAQNSDEEKVLQINSAYDKATLSGDVAYFERVLAPNFVGYHPDGSVGTRAEVLEKLKNEKAKPTYRLLSMSSDDVKVKVSGDLAYVTGKWKASTSGMDSNPIPHEDTGYYGSVFEKQNGNWLLVADHSSEKAHTAEELEPSLKTASDKYDEAIRTKNVNLLDQLLSAEFISINEEGKMNNKSEEMAQLGSSDLVISSLTTSDKKFKIHRSTALETGIFDVKGLFKKQAFAEKGRYSSVWFYSGGKWLLASDHSTTIK